MNFSRFIIFIIQSSWKMVNMNEETLQESGSGSGSTSRTPFVKLLFQRIAVSCDVSCFRCQKHKSLRRFAFVWLATYRQCKRSVVDLISPPSPHLNKGLSKSEGMQPLHTSCRVYFRFMRWSDLPALFFLIFARSSVNFLVMIHRGLFLPDNSPIACLNQ